MSTKRMLIDASHPEETRVVVLDGNRLEDYAVEIEARQQIKGNIYLAKVTRVEPSLQAAFVDYGGNRHGFLAFNEIHPDYYQIPVADREALLAEQAAAVRVVDGDDDDLNAEEAPDDGNDEQSGVTATNTDGEIGDTASGVLGEYAAISVDAEAIQGAADADSGATDEDRADADEDVGGTSVGSVEVRNEPVLPPEPVGAADDDDDIDRPRVRTSTRYYKIQEVIKRRQIMLVQVVKEERGNKGAALTTYLSLAGRYCVLMPNTSRGGGISRKINAATDRKRLKRILSDLNIPDGVAVIVRTAGSGRSKAEIKRDYEYLMRLWNNIREKTLESSAPTLIHEEGNLIKRSIRDLYGREVEEIIVRGESEYRTAKEFMKLLIPSHAKRVKLDDDIEAPLFQRFPVEAQLDAMHKPVVQLKSGGYLVINPTEALVSIDVNSGRATRERHIEETALRTNLEAADEVARQLRLRDLAGLIVIDFIDMENTRNQSQVERRLKEAMKTDRARVQLGRISAFGLLELSRQRLRPSLLETSFEVCSYCSGAGMRRTLSSMALAILRRIEEEGLSGKLAEAHVFAPAAVAMYLLNEKRGAVAEMERRYAFKVSIEFDDHVQGADYRIDRVIRSGGAVEAPPIEGRRTDAAVPAEDVSADGGEDGERDETTKRTRRRRPRRRKRTDDEATIDTAPANDEAGAEEIRADAGDDDDTDGADESNRSKRRRRGKRGGRRRNRRTTDADAATSAPQNDNEDEDEDEDDGEVEPRSDIPAITSDDEWDGIHGAASLEGVGARPELDAATGSEDETPDTPHLAPRGRRRPDDRDETPELANEPSATTNGDDAQAMASAPTVQYEMAPDGVFGTQDEDMLISPTDDAAHDDVRIDGSSDNGDRLSPEAPSANRIDRTKVIEVGGQDDTDDRPRKGWWQRLIE